MSGGTSSGATVPIDRAGTSTGSSAVGSGQDAASGSDAVDATPADDRALPLSSGSGTGTEAGVDASSGLADGSAGGCPGVFCEDFEKGSLDPAIWTTKVTMAGAVPLQPPPAVQTTTVAHGKYALRVHSDPGKGAAYDFIITSTPKISGHHFGRAYFNATPKPPGAHTEFLYAGTKGFPGTVKYLEVAGIGTGWQLTWVSLPNGGESYASGGALPPGRWMCLEWELNDTPDQASVFVDGNLAPDFTRPIIKSAAGVTTGLVGGFAEFGFGYYDWHPNTAAYAFDLYYDDIVLDTKRIGCLP